MYTKQANNILILEENSALNFFFYSFYRTENRNCYAQELHKYPIWLRTHQSLTNAAVSHRWLQM